MRNIGLNVATWILARFVPMSDREELIGDLTEEYARRAKAGLPYAVLGWYLRHICASIPPLLWARLTRATWPITLGVALLAYFVVGAAQLVIQWAVQSFTLTAHRHLDLVIIFPTVLLIGYISERFRHRSAIFLGAVLLLAIAAMTLWSAGNAPVLYRLAYLLLGPSVAFIGAAMNCRSKSAP
jgi:hypothetical protein